MFSCVVEDLPHYVELMVTGEEECLCFLILALCHFCEVLNDISQTLTGQDFFPQIGGLVTIRIRRITFAEVVAFVEGEEIRLVFGQARCHIDFVGIHGEVNEAAGKLQQRFFGVAVFAVLFLGVVDGLAGPGVFEFKGGNSQAVNKHDHVNRQVRLTVGVVDLASDGENIFVEVGSHVWVGVVVGQAVEQGQVGIVNGQPAFED